MRRFANALVGLALSGALAVSPVLAHAAMTEGSRLFEIPPPAEVDEQLADPTVEERNGAKGSDGSSAPSSATGGPASDSASRSRGGRPIAPRLDDAPGLQAHGLRAPPA